MDFNTVVQQVKKGDIASLYLIHGEETFLAQKLEKMIIDQLLSEEERDTNLFVFDGDPIVSNLINIVESIPFLGEKNVVVVRESRLFRATAKGQSSEDGDAAPQDNSMHDQLSKLFANMPAYSHLLFCTSQKADKRLKLYKTFEKYGVVAAVENLKPRDARNWLQSKVTEMHKKISYEAMEYIVTAISFMPQISVSFLDNEMEKTALYVGNRTQIELKDLMAILSPIPEVSIFALLDSISQKKLTLSLNLLQEQIKNGEHPLKIIALLARQVRLLNQVRALTDQGLSPKQTAEILKLHPFVAEKLQKQCKAFNANKLQKALLSLAKIDWNLKSGRAGAESLESFIIKMCE